MKQKIFMYLFVFMALLVLYQYINSKNTFQDMNATIENYRALNKTYKDSLASLDHKIQDLSYFNLERNEDAISYFERDGYNVDSLIPVIKDQLHELNFEKKNPLIPYESSEGRKMLINTVKILNHKWIVADFSDGEYWGELFINYFVNEDRTIDFELEESFLYPFD